MKKLYKQTFLGLLTVSITACSHKSPNLDKVTSPPSTVPAEVLHSCPMIDAARAPKLLWSTGGFSAPESAVYDKHSKAIYVSNIVGNPGEKDGQGWISKLNLDGTLIQEKWHTGQQSKNKALRASLNAPKGLRLQNGTIWIADIDKVVAVRISDAEKTSEIHIPEAKFLNDVEVIGNNVYVSDTAAGQLYEIRKAKKFKVFSQGKELESPNGLVHDGSSLILASWGTDLKADFSTSQSGRVLSLSLRTKALTPWTEKPMGHLDGIELDGKNAVLVSDWSAGKVFYLKRNGECFTLLEGFKGSADLTFIPGTRTLILPLMNENRVVAYKLPTW